MKDANYSDLWRFFTSIGVILIVVAVMLPIFSQTHAVSVLNVPVTNFSSSEAESLYEKALNRAEWLQNYWWIISVVLFPGGLLFLVQGLSKWSRKQEILDQTDEAKLEEIKRKIPPQEKFAKYSSKRLLDKFSLNSFLINGITTENIASTQKQSEFSEIRSKAIEIERIASQELTKLLSPKYDILQNRKINHFEYDVIAINKSGNDDTIFEIKYFETGASVHRIKDSIERLENSAKNYATVGRNVARFYLIVILHDVAFEELTLEQENVIHALRDEIAYTNKELLIDSLSSVRAGNIWEKIRNDLIM